MRMDWLFVSLHLGMVALHWGLLYFFYSLFGKKGFRSVLEAHFWPGVCWKTCIRRREPCLNLQRQVFLVSPSSQLYEAPVYPSNSFPFLSCPLPFLFSTLICFPSLGYEWARRVGEGGLTNVYLGLWPGVVVSKPRLFFSCRWRSCVWRCALLCSSYLLVILYIYLLHLFYYTCCLISSDTLILLVIATGLVPSYASHLVLCRFYIHADCPCTWGKVHDASLTRCRPTYQVACV